MRLSEVPAQRTVKALVVEGADERPVLLLVRGDHEVNPIKAEKLPQVKAPLTFASPEAIRAAFGAGPGSLGAVGFDGVVIADRTVAHMADFVSGANEDDWHLTGVNFGRDCRNPQSPTCATWSTAIPVRTGGARWSSRAASRSAMSFSSATNTAPP